MTHLEKLEADRNVCLRKIESIRLERDKIHIDQHSTQERIEEYDNIIASAQIWYKAISIIDAKMAHLVELEYIAHVIDPKTDTSTH